MTFARRPRHRVYLCARLLIFMSEHYTSASFGSSTQASSVRSFVLLYFRWFWTSKHLAHPAGVYGCYLCKSFQQTQSTPRDFYVGLCYFSYTGYEITQCLRAPSFGRLLFGDKHVHSDDRPNHYLESSSGLQKGENDAPPRIHLALLLGSKASVSQTWTRRWPVLVFPRDNEWPLSGESVHALALPLGFSWHVHLGPLVYLLRETYECHQVFPRSVQLFYPVGSFKTEVIYRAECTKIHLLDPVPG